MVTSRMWRMFLCARSSERSRPDERGSGLGLRYHSPSGEGSVIDHASCSTSRASSNPRCLYLANRPGWKLWLDVSWSGTHETGPPRTKLGNESNTEPRLHWSGPPRGARKWR